jgi:hypothetical protein
MNNLLREGEKKREKREGDRERVWEFGSLGILLKFKNTKS